MRLIPRRKAKKSSAALIAANTVKETLSISPSRAMQKYTRLPTRFATCRVESRKSNVINLDFIVYESSLFFTLRFPRKYQVIEQHTRIAKVDLKTMFTPYSIKTCSLEPRNYLSMLLGSLSLSMYWTSNRLYATAAEMKRIKRLIDKQ